MNPYRIGIIVVVVLCLLVVFGGILPKKESFDTQQEMVAQKEIELKTEEKYVEKVRENLARIEEEKETWKKIDSLLPQSARLPELLYFFQGVASQSGLVIEGLSPSLPKMGPDEGGGEEIKEVRVDLGLNGGYSEFKEFLSKVENSSRLIEIESLSFTFPSDIEKAEQEIFGFGITTKAYFQ